jgi:hypothetical protein
MTGWLIIIFSVLQSNISASDVAIWCWLAPDGVLKSFQGFEKILDWHKNIAELAEIKVRMSYSPLSQSLSNFILFSQL